MRRSNVMALFLLSFLIPIIPDSAAQDPPLSQGPPIAPQFSKTEPNATANPNLINSSLESQIKKVVEEAGESELVKILKERLQKQDDQIERSDKSSTLNFLDSISTPISALAALFSAGAAFYVGYVLRKTRKLLEPIERPALDLKEIIATQSPGNEGGSRITIKNIFHNVGRHPASNIGFKAIVATIGKDSEKTEGDLIQTYRRLYPDATHHWTIIIELSIRHDNISEIIIEIDCVYEDMLQSDHEPYDDDLFYLILNRDTNVTRYASLKEIEQYKPLLNLPNAKCPIIGVL